MTIVKTRSYRANDLAITVAHDVLLKSHGASSTPVIQSGERILHRLKKKYFIAQFL
jgi:hypothetical protein